MFQFEVFNFLYVTEQDKKFVVHCFECARKINYKLEGFVILNQYGMDELMDVYDNFQLGTVVSRDNRYLQGSEQNLETWKTCRIEFYLSRSRNSL